MPPYQRFACWRACHELAVALQIRTRAFPVEEHYALAAQLRRAVFSAAANIAEGSAKRGPAEFRRYLDMSLGSLSEISYALLLARDTGILTADEWKALDDLRDKAGRLTWRLYRTMK